MRPPAGLHSAIENDEQKIMTTKLIKKTEGNSCTEESPCEVNEVLCCNKKVQAKLALCCLEMVILVKQT